MEDFKAIFQQISEKIGATARSETVVGEPIEVGGVTLVPLTEVSLGFGAGLGSGEGDSGGKGKGSGEGKGEGAGGGGGARVSPVAMIAFTAEGVEVLPVPGKKSKLDQLVDKIPGWVEKIEAKLSDEG